MCRLTFRFSFLRNPAIITGSLDLNPSPASKPPPNPHQPRRDQGIPHTSRHLRRHDQTHQPPRLHLARQQGPLAVAPLPRDVLLLPARGRHGREHDGPGFVPPRPRAAEEGAAHPEPGPAPEARDPLDAHAGGAAGARLGLEGERGHLGGRAVGEVEEGPLARGDGRDAADAADVVLEALQDDLAVRVAEEADGVGELVQGRGLGV